MLNLTASCLYLTDISMRDKNRFRKTWIPILGLLTWRPMAGYELRTEIEGSLQNFWSESFGQLYPQLAALEAENMIEPDPDAASDGRGKKVYRITDAGREQLAAWLDEPPDSRPPRNELLLKVFFGAEGDTAAIATHCRAALQSARETLDRFRGIESRLKEMLPERPQARFWLMSVRSGISQTEAHIRWCEETILDIDTFEPLADPLEKSHE